MRKQFLNNTHKKLILKYFFNFKKIIKFGTKNAVFQGSYISSEVYIIRDAPLEKSEKTKCPG